MIGEPDNNNRIDRIINEHLTITEDKTMFDNLPPDTEGKF